MEPLDRSRAVLLLAERQHGVVARQQLLALGLGAEAVKTRCRTGRLVRLYPGVYALGHRALRPQGWSMAAVLACGPGAVLSHRSAAAQWGLRPSSGRIEVTAARQRDPAPATIVVRRSRTLRPWERTTIDGLPITSVARTLLDLAAVVPPHHLRRAVERAEQQELFDLREVQRVLDAHPRRAGRRALVTLLEDAQAHGLPVTRSDLEAAFLQLCLDHGVPRPQVNRYNNAREVGFRWPAHRLIVEVDGWSSHKTRRAFADDRARDRARLSEGIPTVRLTWDDVSHAARRTASELLILLARDASDRGVP